MNDGIIRELDSLFYPKNIAVIGASPKATGFLWGGNSFLEGAIKLNFKGKLYPVHPTAESILGLTAYKSILDIPDEVDLVIFSVPHSVVLKVMEECVEKKVKFVHLFTAGFSETGLEENISLEKQLISMAKKGGVRVIGPNCMGLYCPEGGLSWSKSMPGKIGTTGFLSQSGQLAGHFVDTGEHHGLSFSKVVSFGNSSDLKCHDFLKYLALDEKTKSIGAYLEGLKDGKAFFQTARELTRKKPLVAWKGGQTEGGSRATTSHTASIAGSQAVWQSMCKQAGIIQVHSLDEMVFTLTAFQKLPLTGGTNVAILGGAGGGSVTMTDLAEKEGLKVPRLSENSINELRTFVPLQGSSVANPLDMMVTLFDIKNFIRTMELLRDDPNIDALIFSQPVHWSHQVGGRAFLDAFIKMTTDGMKVLEKPMLVALEHTLTLDGEVVRREAFEKYHQVGIAAFPSFPMAAKVLSNLDQYKKYLDAEHAR
ncbi:MAG: CoA-binding protein [Deltaproteobacteria bacterium]|nr:CoA-binding protein [Deltaproteobacteria bacterium]